MLGFDKVYGKSRPHDFNRFIDSAESWAFACIYKNAFSIAKMQGKLFKKSLSREGQMELKPITNHPWLELMKNVNPHYNRFELMALLGIFLDTTGNAYWWLVKDGLRVPRLIWHIPSSISHLFHNRGA